MMEEDVTTYAKYSYKRAWLNTEFGENYAKRIFGEQFIQTLPIASKGKNKGKIKNHFIEWKKVEAGGWVRTGQYDWDGMQASGYVEKRIGKVIEVKLYSQEWGKEAELVKEFIKEK